MYQPKDRNELERLILNCYHGKIYLDEIDVSRISDMSDIFSKSYYDYKYDISDIDKIFKSVYNDISDWDVRGVKNMNSMFKLIKLPDFIDISNWNVSSVTNMGSMFSGCEFNQDLSKWCVKNVKNLSNMFYISSFSRERSIDDISEWVTYLDKNVNMDNFYPGIDSYEDFVKLVNWDRVKQHIINKISSSESHLEQLEYLKLANRVSDIERIFRGVNSGISI